MKTGTSPDSQTTNPCLHSVKLTSEFVQAEQVKGNTMNAQIKAYKEKTQAELQKIKAQLAKFAADEKAKDEQVAVDVINQMKTTNQNIEKQLQALETAADSDIQQEKADIDAGLTKLKTDLAQLRTKLNTPRTKAS
jgi:uncharacterized protein YpuA (DUF1002 family)